MIHKFRPYALRLLSENSVIITFVDIGSRNGVLELPDLADFVEAYGFEPNPAEYRKLITGKTDRALITGASPPRYRKLSYFPFAMGNLCGKHEFYVTPGPGACGLLEPNLERLQEIVWKGESANRKSFAEEHFAGFKKIEVDVTTLETFAADQLIEHIDYLKIDVEGCEYEVIEGARKLLPKTGVIKVEVCFIPFRKGQKLFSHVDLLLRDFGFDLLRYETTLGHVGYKERSRPVGYVPPGFSDPSGQPLSTDAIYVNRNISDSRSALAQAIVLLEKNYTDEALHILRTKTSVDDAEFFDLLRTFPGSGGQRLTGLGYQTVEKIVGLISRAVNCVRG